MRCRYARELSSLLEVDAELSPEQRHELEAHVAACDDCGRFLEDLQRHGELLEQAFEITPVATQALTRRLGDRVMATVRDLGAAGETGPRPRWSPTAAFEALRRLCVARPAVVAAGVTLALCATAVGVVMRYQPIAVLERRISDCIERELKCTDLKVQVAPYADPALLEQGRLQTLVIAAKRLDKSGLGLNDLYLKVTDVTIDIDSPFRLDQLRNSSHRSASIRATIKESELNAAFARMEDLPVKQFALKFEKDHIVCTGVYRYLIGNKLKMDVDLDLKNDRDNTGTRRSEVNLVARRASVNGLSLPESRVNALLARINPIIDFTDLPFSPRAEKITIHEDSLIISA